MLDTVFLQCQASQLDFPVYERLEKLAPDATALVLWNDYGVVRRHVDPELGIVPKLIEDRELGFRHEWIDSASHNWEAVVERVLALKPRYCVLSDQPQMDRLRIARALRRVGVETILRSDKNLLSETPREGFALWLERRLIGIGYDRLAPASELTRRYYGVASADVFAEFPYATDERKFAPDAATRAAARARIRSSLRIGADDPVFVSATKFSDRESPEEVAESFARTLAARPDTYLIALGDGPRLPAIKQWFTKRGIERVAFPGFVPFKGLQDWFFAADVFLHLVDIGPWEASPQDALVAGMGVVVTRQVGSTQVLLDPPLDRFRVSLGDHAQAAARMVELADYDDIGGLFAPAREKALDFTAERVGERLLAAMRMPEDAL